MNPTLKDLERDPAFRHRARLTEGYVLDQYCMGRSINLGDVARQLEVPVPIAGAWLARIALQLGDNKIELRLTGATPQ